jgi:hypothetical protein
MHVYIVYNYNYRSGLFDWVSRHTDTVLAIWRRSGFTGGGRPQVHFRALLKAQMSS